MMPKDTKPVRATRISGAARTVMITMVRKPGVLGMSALNTMAIPVTPPKEKLFGNLNT